MLSIANDLSRYALAAGEPFIMEVIWVDADGERQDLPDDAMVLTFWVPSSSEIVRRIEFDRVVDEAGKEVFRIALDGTFSEALRGRSGIQVELARRYRMGRLVVGTGELTIRTSSPDLPSLDSAGIGDVAARLTIRASATFGDPPTLSVRPVQYASAIVPPSYSIRSGDVVALIL